MKLSYTVLSKAQEMSDWQLCQQLSKDDLFANARIDFNKKNKPVMQTKSHGYFNPINRFWFAENTVTFAHKKTVVSKLGNILKNYSQAIAGDELSVKADKCSLTKISNNVKTLEKKLFKGANEIQKQILSPLFSEIHKNLKQGKEIHQFQSTVPTDPKSTQIKAEKFFELMQKPEGLKQKYQILENGSIYIRPKAKQGWIFKNPSEAAASKIATAQMIPHIFQQKAYEATLTDEKKCNLKVMCKTLEQMKAKMVRNTSESEALEISRPITDAIIFLDKTYRAIQDAKPTFVERVYNASTGAINGATYFVARKTGNLALGLLKGGWNLTKAGVFNLAGRVPKEITEVKLGAF